MWSEEGGSTPSATSGGSRLGNSAARVFALVFAAYLAGAVASAVAFGSTTASAFFVPGGITVAALLLTRPSRWPAIVAALVLAELLVDRVSGLTWAVSAGFALGNAAEALVGAALVRTWCGGTPDLRRTRDLGIYVLGAAGVGALVGGLIGGTVKLWAFGVPWIQGVTQWFAGDAISVLVVGTSILLWSKQSHILRSRPLETAAILCAAAGLSFVGFETQIPPGTTVLPILAFAALRLGVLGTALTGTVVAAIGNYLTGSHRGLIGQADTADPIKVASAQIFVAVLVLSAMVIAQEVAKRTSAVRERDTEHARAAVLQSALHPARRPLTPGIEYCVSYEPADLVHGLGGDFYDVVSLPKNYTYLAVGDIVGHGLTAVEDMAQLRSAGRTLAHRGQSPAQILADLNPFTEDVLQSQFATMVVAVFDHAAGLLTYCSAGHPPAFLRRAYTGQVLRLADGNGPVLGPVMEPGFEDQVIRIDHGDTLVLYTDGLVERAGAPVSEGIARAETTLAEWPAEELLDCRALTAAIVPPPRSDDVCMLVVRFD